MKELGDALKTIFQKVAQFLDIFDLSFFISGAAAVGAIWTYLWQADNLPTMELPGWILTLSVLVGIYCSGLICFAMGRLFRSWHTLLPKEVAKKRWTKFDGIFERSLKGHGLTEQSPFKEYLARTSKNVGTRGIWALYVRLWADLRSDDRMGSSISLLNRYWVMAATYDGLAFALLIWSGVVALLSFDIGADSTLSPKFGVGLAIFLVIFALAALREAGRYSVYQVYELVAAIAARRELPDQEKTSSEKGTLTINVEQADAGKHDPAAS